MDLCRQCETELVTDSYSPFCSSECTEEAIYEGEWNEEQWCETDSDICPYCGEPMLDDMEVGQGYHCTAPCWMWATGQREEAMKWEQEHND